MGTHVSAGGFTFDKVSVGGTWYWTVRATNVQSSSQLYQVSEIMSPWGRLGAVDFPIPGDVISEMASSIVQLQQQLSPMVAVIGSASFAITVTEGDPTIQAGVVKFQNVGAFGSFLSVTATPDSPWLSANPSSVAGLNKNDQGQAIIYVAPATLLASGSPYSGHVNLQDNRSPSTVIPVTVTVTVVPRPTLAVSPTAAALSYAITGAAAGGPVVATVSNSGPAGSILIFATARAMGNSPWLAFTPTTGGPLASGGTAAVTFSVVPAGVPQIPGTYTETIIFSAPNSSNDPVSVVVTLTVSP